MLTEAVFVPEEEQVSNLIQELKDWGYKETQNLIYKKGCKDYNDCLIIDISKTKIIFHYIEHK